MLRRVRITLQISFFVLFVLFFFFFNAFRSESGLSALAWFLKLNPFTFLITSIASRQVAISYLIVGFAVLAITIVFGRVFCGMFCPLGSMIDFFDKLLRGKPKIKQSLRPSIKLQGLKYVFLISLVFLALFGVTFPLFMDPLCLVPRIFGEIFKPSLLVILKVLHIGGDGIAKSNIVTKGAYLGTIITFILFALVILGALFDRRFWCQYICPSGAFLGLISRFSILERRQIENKCKTCGLCAKRNCATRAISGEKYEITSKAECIVCGLCTADKRSCCAFSFSGPSQDYSRGADLNRRQVSSALISGLFFLPVLTSKNPRRRPHVSYPIRPPGSIEEAQFQAKCITCGACISVCPEHALHPCNILEDTFANWNTPKLVPRTGFCNDECNRCAQACPTGALQPFAIDEKKKIKMGTAFINRGLCRPWRGDSKCRVCRDKCVYEAINSSIVTIHGKDFEVPEVSRRKCTGCGICEHLCPVKGTVAIKVYSYGDRRRKLAKK